MKVLFAYPNSTKSIDLPMGIAYLSGVLRQHNHTTGLLDLTFNPSLSSILQTMRGYDLLCISSGTLERSIAFKIAELWKKVYGLPVLMGGPDATTEPETIIKNPNVDAVCIGEGEYALLDFVEHYEKTEKLPFHIRNFWVKCDKCHKLHRNPLRPLLENLDLLPFPDRTIFYIEHIENKYPGTSFLTSRGCPFTCSMCINHYLQRLYEGLGKYTRFRSIDNLFKEINFVKDHYRITRLMFVDDTFTINKKRLNEFCKRYRKEIDVPFIIMGRCNTVNKDMLVKLRKAGCLQIAYGIESGNNFIRNKILNRKMSKTHIMNAFKWTKQAKIGTVSFNMMGIPFESRKRIFDTINLNRMVKPDLVQITLMFPFPKTDIEGMAFHNGMIEKGSCTFTDYYADSVIKLSSMTRHELHSLSRMIAFYVYLPRIFYPFIRLLEAFLTLTSKTFLSKFLGLFIAVFRKKVLERKFWKGIK